MHGSENYETLAIRPDKEHRFFVNDSSNPLKIELLNGSAEILGAKMIPNRLYKFAHSFAVVTSNEGCNLKLIGDISRSYCVKKNKKVDELHTSLENIRCRAQDYGEQGPITLLAGPTDVGKSTICRSLVNYASREGRKPLFVDLDVGQSFLSIPGTMSILNVDRPVDVTDIDEKNLSVYYFGYKSPGLNMLLYFLLIQRLGATVQSRIEKSREVAVSGAVIDTCGWVEGQGYQALLVAAKSFLVNCVIVIEDQKLLSRLKKDLSPRIKIIFIPRLSGSIERNPTQRRSNRDRKIHEYFYGTNNSLAPHLIDVKFTDIQIYKVKSSINKIDNTELCNIKNYISLSEAGITPDIINQVLALSYVDDLKEDIVLTSVLGFVKVQKVDMKERFLSLLSPQPSPLPKKFLLMGNMHIESGKNMY